MRRASSSPDREPVTTGRSPYPAEGRAHVLSANPPPGRHSPGHRSAAGAGAEVDQRLIGYATSPGVARNRTAGPVACTSSPGSPGRASLAAVVLGRHQFVACSGMRPARPTARVNTLLGQAVSVTTLTWSSRCCGDGHPQPTRPVSLRPGPDGFPRRGRGARRWAGQVVDRHPARAAAGLVRITTRPDAPTPPSCTPSAVSTSLTASRSRRYRRPATATCGG